ncbi:MAG: DUF748 domain-containing protein [Desulfuromonadaceae bacterium]|nr:DUF748 domain-containing protein [Desulfuromonadaceae bacterium]
MSENTQTIATAAEGKPRRLVKFMRVCVYVAALFLLILALLPAGLRLGARYWLNQQPHLEAEIDNINLNLFSATCALEGLRLKYKGDPSLTVERLAVGLKYLPLWNKQAFIDYVELDGLRLVLEQVVAAGEEELDGLRVGGIMVPGASAEQGDESATLAPDAATPWDFGWNRVAIDNSKIIWKQPDWGADLIIEKAHVSNVASWKPEGYSDLELQLRVNDAPLALAMQSQPFALHPTAKGHIKLDRFALEKLAPILASFGIHDVAGMLSCDLKPEVTLGAGDALSLNVNGSLALVGGALTTEQIHIAEAGFNWSGTSVVSAMPKGTTKVALEGTLQIPVLDVEDIGTGFALQQQGFNWSGSINALLEADAAPEVEIKGGLGTDAFTLLDRQHQRLLASWAQLKIDHFKVTEKHVQLGQLDLSNLVALRPSISSDEAEPALTQCGTISLIGLEVELPAEEAGPKVVLSALNLNGLGVELIRHAGGRTNIDQWSNLSGQDAEGEQSETPPEGLSKTQPGAPQQAEVDQSAPELAWRLDSFQIDGNSYIRVTDASVTPEMVLHLNELNFSLKQLNSAEVQTLNPFNLNTKLGRFSTLQVEGAMSVLSSAPAGSVKTNLHGFPMYSVAPYVENAIGSRIEKGELDFNVSANIEDNQLKLKSQADLRSFTFGPMTEEQQEQISSNLGMPISLAMALLRDKNGDIHLDIPVTGDLASPDIAIGPIVRKALLGAIQETVKLALKPLGILSGAGKLIGIGADLKLPPVLFAPAETTPADAGAALKPLGELLATRPQLRVVLQAPLTQADSEAIHAQYAETHEKDKPASKKQKKPQDKAEEEGLDPEQFGILATALLEERLQIIKEQLLTTSGVDQKQILLSQPSLALTADAPRVEIRF